MLKVKINKDNSVRVFKKMFEEKGTAFNKRINRNMLVSEGVEGYAYLFRNSGLEKQMWIGWSGDYDKNSCHNRYYDLLESNILETTAEEYLKESSTYNTTNLIHSLDSDILKEEYLVFVENKKAPRVIHNTLDEAEEEAQRLAKYPNNIGRKIVVVKVESKFMSEVRVQQIISDNTK